MQYDPVQIIRLSVAPGLQTLVELSPGENIQTIRVGDSAAWAVSAGKRGDFFFVKNVSANAITNMSVVTKTRIATQSGQVRAMISTDVYNALGTKVLIPKGPCPWGI